VAELPELGTLDCRQIAALADPAPWTRQSGEWRGKSSSVAAAPRPRRPLHRCHGRSPVDPALRVFHQRLRVQESPSSSPSSLSLAVVSKKVVQSEPWRLVGEG
jgi:transposase